MRYPILSVTDIGRGQENIVLVEKVFRTPEISTGREQTILALLFWRLQVNSLGYKAQSSL